MLLPYILWRIFAPTPFHGQLPLHYVLFNGVITRIHLLLRLSRCVIWYSVIIRLLRAILTLRIQLTNIVLLWRGACMLLCCDLDAMLLIFHPRCPLMRICCSLLHCVGATNQFRTRALLYVQYITILVIYLCGEGYLLSSDQLICLAAFMKTCD